MAHPESAMHPAALARILSRPPQDVGRVMAQLEDEGVLASARTGRTRPYELAVDLDTVADDVGSLINRAFPRGRLVHRAYNQTQPARSTTAPRSRRSRASTTVNPLHFEDLDARAFEDLVRKLLRSRRCWRSLEAVGRSGSDEGRDIEGIELVGLAPETDPAIVPDNAATRRWVVQVKRHRSLGPTDLERIVEAALDGPDDAPYGLLIATAADPTPAARRAFQTAAKERGVANPDLWSRSFLEDELMRPEHAALLWHYFGLGSGIEGTQAMPSALEGSAGRNLPLVGRDDELRRLRHGGGDWIISGRPGTGKTRLAFEGGGARFLGSLQPHEIAESIRIRQPRRVVVDDAGLDPSRLEVLSSIRGRGLEFDILATAWPEDVPALRRLLPKAAELNLDLLDRAHMDAIVRAMGVIDYFMRGEILEQAEGRPGWAVALSGAVSGGRLDEVFSGRVLVTQVESFIDRMAREPDATLMVVSALAAMGHAAPDEIHRLGELLRLPAPQLQRALNDAASGGLLERNYAGESGWEVRPIPLRHALAARILFDAQVPALSFDALVQTFPRLRPNLLSAAVRAARVGSAVARRQVDALLDSGALDVAMLTEYATIDEGAARRAVSIVLSAPDSVTRGTLEVLEVAAGRYALREAVQALLALGVGDERPMHANPDHATRVLGDLATRLLPNGRTVFPLRVEYLSIATGWLAESPIERQVVWARLAARLLQPSIEGNWIDLASHRTARLYAGFESPENLRGIADDMWPTVEERLSALSGVALNELVGLLDAWLRLSKGFSGAFDTKPPPEAVEVGIQLSKRMLESMSLASQGRPAVALRIADLTRQFRSPTRVSVSPEFRLLTWQPWRWRGRGRPRMDRLLRGLGRNWANETPETVMSRVSHWRDEAAIAGRSLLPAIHTAMEALGTATEDLDGFIMAAIRAGVCHEAQSLLRIGLTRTQDPPSWLGDALVGQCRQAVVYAATTPGANPDAASSAVLALNENDVGLVDSMLLGRDSADAVARGLLEHPVAAIRGAASLVFRLGGIQHGVPLPDEWHQTWRNSFLDAAPTAGQHAEYQLTELLKALVGSDPDLVEQWLVRRLDEGGWQAFHGTIPFHSEAIFRELPLDHRDRLIRRYASAQFMSALLPLVLSPDPGWIDTLLVEEVISEANILFALSMVTKEFDARRPLVEALAPVLLKHGVAPERVAATARSGTWMGEESTRHTTLIRHFEEMRSSADAAVSEVGEAGVRILTRERDRALEEERRERITGI